MNKPRVSLDFLRIRLMEEREYWRKLYARDHELYAKGMIDGLITAQQIAQRIYDCEYKRMNRKKP